MVRVLYLTTGCFDKGGVSRYSRYQIRALRELFGSDNVKPISLLGPDELGFEEAFDVDWHGARGSVGDKIRLMQHLLSRAALWRPTVVHAAHVHLANAARTASRLCRAKTLLNVYGLEIWSGLSPLRKWGLRHVDRVIADCHFTAEYVAANRLHPQRPTVIWDCMDVDRFFPADCPRAILDKYGIYSKSEYFVILSLGRLSRGAAHKGYDRLIRVFSRLASEYERLRLVIAGRGDDRPRLEALARELGVEAKIRFAGAIDEADLADVYRAASVFSLVSDRGPGRGEGIPMTPLEAMACGVPILVGNQDGSSEAVFDNRNGYVVDSLDLDQHQARLRTMIDDSAQLQKMREACVAISKEYFDYRRFAKELELAYRFGHHDQNGI
jgi:phosphatidylinositol alpha-1,6-mannosyltransferase